MWEKVKISKILLIELCSR